ncbi:hypothetical protein A2J03_03355 [Rhodococcus sp. EPR-157]|nr:hypothetical protein A2J03_03355 [Rhodococcus sp. EPR-157]
MDDDNVGSANHRITTVVRIRKIEGFGLAPDVSQGAGKLYSGLLFGIGIESLGKSCLVQRDGVSLVASRIFERRLLDSPVVALSSKRPSSDGSEASRRWVWKVPGSLLIRVVMLRWRRT